MRLTCRHLRLLGWLACPECGSGMTFEWLINNERLTMYSQRRALAARFRELMRCTEKANGGKP